MMQRGCDLQPTGQLFKSKCSDWLEQGSQARPSSPDAFQMEAAGSRALSFPQAAALPEALLPGGRSISGSLKAN